MLGQIEVASIGLVKYIYYGKAMRWPSRHHSWGIDACDEPSSRLSQRVTELIMPPGAAELISRNMEGIMHVTWELNKTNPQLANFGGEEWRELQRRILASVSRKITEARFKLNHRLESISLHEIEGDDIEVLDHIRHSLHSALLLLPSKISPRETLSQNRIKQIRENFENLGIVRRLEPITITDSRGIFIVVNGDDESVLSLTDAIVNHTPISMVCKIGHYRTGYFILLRLPDVFSRPLMDLLMSLPNYSSLSLRCSEFIPKFYGKNLFHNLRMDDGSWDDDVSGFLSQRRIRGK